MTYIVMNNKFPRVTSILEETKPYADKVRLQNYRDNLDEAGRIELEQKKQEGAKRGSAVHTIMEEWLSPILGVPREEWLGSLPQLKENPWTSQYVSGIKKYVNRFMVKEKFVWSKKGYAGTLDCIVEELDGTYKVWDWKTSNKRKKKEWVYNYRLQVAAYGQAYMERYPGVDINGGRVLIAVKDGKRATIFEDSGFEYLEHMTVFNNKVHEYLVKTQWEFF